MKNPTTRPSLVQAIEAPADLRGVFEMLVKSLRCGECGCGPGDWLGWSAEVHDAKARRLHRFAPKVDDEGAKQ